MPLFALDGISPILPRGFHWIAGSADVIGNVEICEDASVWFGAVIRGDNERITIGRGTNIQDNAVLHTDPGYPMSIGAGCTIGHRAMLHGCTIGEGSLVGMGATVLNGAKIGKNCLIGADALITEGKVIPDNTLVLGAPGKVARELTPDDLAGLARAAASYIRKARRYAEGLVRL
jgi:carbonic anhydrase/acetyltransferase-like protein (isoleucine patch superfamily)